MRAVPRRVVHGETRARDHREDAALPRLDDAVRRDDLAVPLPALRPRQLPQAFARLAAVHGGTYMLNRGLEGAPMFGEGDLTVEYGADGKCSGVKAGEHIARTKLVLGDPSYFGGKTKKVGQAVRAIALLDALPRRPRRRRRVGAGDLPGRAGRPHQRPLPLLHRRVARWRPRASTRLPLGASRSTREAPTRRSIAACASRRRLELAATSDVLCAVALERRDGFADLCIVRESICTCPRLFTSSGGARSVYGTQAAVAGGEVGGVMRRAPQRGARARRSGSIHDRRCQPTVVTLDGVLAFVAAHHHHRLIGSASH